MVNNPGKKEVLATGVFCAQDLINKSGCGLYTLIRLAMLRSSQLAAGNPALIEHSLTEKTVTVVFKEIAEGKVVLKNKKSSK